MPANNDMEILMQQKMEEFRIEPSPADWQAIYERLHPKKDRRFLWWWFPLVAGLLFGGYWITIQNRSQNATTTDSPAAISPADPNHGIAENQANQKKDPVSAASATAKPTIETSIPPAASSIQSSVEDEQHNNPVHAKLSRNTVSKKSNHTAEGSASDPLPDDIPLTGKETTEGKDAASTMQEPLEISPKLADTNTAEQNQNETAIVPLVESRENDITILKEENKETTAPGEKTHEDSLTTVKPSLEPTVKKNSIPNLSNHASKGWYLGAYAEIGSNKPTEPISLAKAADMNSFPGSGNSSTTTSAGSKSKGLHYAFGVALEKKLKKMSFSFGLGVQSNTWSSTSATYKDSMISGNIFTRTQISNNSSNYTHIAMELPVMLNFRLAGKKHSSYWFTTGLNNLITLKLDQKTDVSIVQSNASYSQDNSLTSKASPYQPQFRIGFMYENTQDRYHWQLTPFMQYGLNSMVKTGSPDIQMLHFGIQTRYYFKKLK
jgi:hypothetical protein